MLMLSLFSGIGGIDLAAEQAGVRTVGFCEINTFCKKVLKQHWPDVPIFPDVTKITKEVLENAKIQKVDIIAGGFPCQPFSTAGNRKGAEDNRNLWPDMLRLVDELRPRWLVGENVNGFIDLGLDTLLASLENKDYTAITFNIPACSVKAPHRRYRVFVVAYSNGDGWTDDMSRRAIKGRVKVKKGSARTWNGRLLDKPGICRVVDGLPEKLDKARLKALGNAVVPAQIYPIFKAIMDIEKARDEVDAIRVMQTLSGVYCKP